MKLTHLEIQKEKNHLEVTYTFKLEPLKAPLLSWKKRKKEDVKEKLEEFEELVDSMYKGKYKHKTKLTGEYIEIKETNQPTTNTSSGKDCDAKKISKNTLCSIIRHNSKKNKSIITITNKGNYFEKIDSFNRELEKRDITITEEARTQIEYLNSVIKKYS